MHVHLLSEYMQQVQTKEGWIIFIIILYVCKGEREMERYLQLTYSLHFNVKIKIITQLTGPGAVFPSTTLTYTSCSHKW